MLTLLNLVTIGSMLGVPIAVKISRIIGLILWGIIVAAVFGTLMLVNYGKCLSGDQAACHNTDYYTTMRVEGMTQQQAEERVRQWKPNSYVGDRLRWSIIRDEWYDGELIGSRQMCLASDTPWRFIDSDCFPRVATSGKHTGEVLPTMNGVPYRESDYYYRLRLRWDASHD